MADVATLVFDIDSGAARSAATDLAKLNQAAVKASSGADKLNRTLRDSSGRFVSSAKVAEQYGSEVQRLAEKYNPALSAVYKYQQTQIELNKAVALGVLTQQQADAALSSYVAQANSAASSANRLAAAQRNNAGQTANVFSQLNDISVMLAAGQNPFVLALQQGTQLNQVWTSMGEEGKKLSGVAGVLRGAFASMLSPMSLLTLGTIAGAGALTQWILSAGDAGDKTESLVEAVDRVSGSVGNLKASLEKINAPFLELYEQFGVAAGRVRDLYEAQVKLNIAVARGELSQSISGLGDTLEKYTNATSAWRSESSRAWEAIRNDLGLTGEAASDFVAQLREIERETSTAIKIEKFQQLVAFLEAAGVEVEKLPVEFAKAALQMNQLAISSAELEKLINDASAATGAAVVETNNWTNAMWGVRGAVASILAGLNAISGQAIGFAAAEAELDALRSGKKVAEARHAGEVARIKLEGELKTKQLTEELGIRGKIQGILETNANLALAAKERELSLEREAAAERERLANSGGGSGGGGAAVAQAERQFQSLRELLEQETLYQVAEYEKRQAQLDAALAKNLVSLQNYQTLKEQLQINFFGAEYERNALNYQMSLEQLDAFYAQGLLKEQQYQMARQQLQTKHYIDAASTDQSAFSAELSGMAQHFGQLNQLAGGGYEALERVQKTFAAGSALINTYLAASQAMADPSLPYFAKFAAVAKVVAAGMGLVNAIKGGGKASSGGGGASKATTEAATKQQQIVEYKIYGDGFGSDLVESVLKQIQQQQKDGHNLIIRRA